MKTTEVETDLRNHPRSWLITGVGGFIGSNLLEKLLRLGQKVVGLDNFSTGYHRNLDDVSTLVGETAWKMFTLIEGDIRNLDHCRKACRGVDFILHQAALGSVPRSIEDPITANQSNVDGFVHMLAAARDAGAKRFVYAGSSATYGDHPGLSKVENTIGKPLSPYAVTKYVNELYAGVFAATYKMECIGLRYFNVFGRRQDPNGAYAAVIPRWIGELLTGNTPTIYGDGETSRDFCYIDNVVQANLLAATIDNPKAVNEVYNIACGSRTTLKELYEAIQKNLAPFMPKVTATQPKYDDFRPGDVRHSLADISKSKQLIGYNPVYNVSRGLSETIEWYVEILLKIKSS